MHDRNFVSSGDPRMSVIVFSLAARDEPRALQETRPEDFMVQIGYSLGAGADREALRPRAEA
jgi:hypothetical protein